MRDFSYFKKKALDKHIKVYHHTKYAIFIVYPPYLYLALGLMVNLLLTPWLLKAECRVGNFTAAQIISPLRGGGYRESNGQQNDSTGKSGRHHWRQET